MKVRAEVGARAVEVGAMKAAAEAEPFFKPSTRSSSRRVVEPFELSCRSSCLSSFELFEFVRVV